MSTPEQTNQASPIPTEPMPVPSSGLRLDLSPLFILTALFLTSGIIIHNPHIAYSPNDASRWNTVYSLLARGSYAFSDDDVSWRAVAREDIEKPQQIPPLETMDMVKINGRFYSSKPPLLPTCVAGVSWVVQKVSGKTFTDDPRFVSRSALILVQVIPFGILLILLRSHIFRFSDSDFARNFCMGAASMGTLLTPWTISLNNHVIAAVTGMVALHAAIRIWYDGRREWYWFSLAGFFAVFTMTIELPAGLLVIVLFFALLYKDPRRTLLFGATVGLIPLAAFFCTNYLAFGSVMPVYLRINEPNGPYHYEGSYWNNPQATDALNEPKWLYVFHMLFGHHGFFLLTPLFVLSLSGIVRHLRDHRREKRTALAAFVLVLSACVMAFYAWRTNNYGGSCQGFRWLFWLIPFWLMFLPLGVELMEHRRWRRGVCYFFLAVSVFSTGSVYRWPWYMSWAHKLFQDMGWINY